MVGGAGATRIWGCLAFEVMGRCWADGYGGSSVMRIEIEEIVSL